MTTSVEVATSLETNTTQAVDSGPGGGEQVRTRVPAASACVLTDLRRLTEAPYRSYAEASERLACLEEHFLGHGDRRAVFATVYALTTRRVAEAIDAGLFADATWMRAYQTEFADHYRRALHAFASGARRSVPTAWRLAFDSAASGHSLVIQDALLGMNAHINFDLPYALEAVAIRPNRAGRYADHQKVNQVLAAVSDEIIAALVRLYGAESYALLDVALGPIDELLLAEGMGRARENAWNNASLLSASAWWNRFVVNSAIEGAAVAAARLVSAVSFAPGLRDILKAAEGQRPALAFYEFFRAPSR